MNTLTSEETSICTVTQSVRHHRQVSDGETFGQRVRRLRLRAGLSQEQMGVYSGTSRQAVYDIERGKTKRVTGTTLVAWAKVLGVAPYFLENGEEMPPADYGPSGIPLEAHLRLITKMDDEGVELATRLIRVLEEKAAPLTDDTAK